MKRYDCNDFKAEILTALAPRTTCGGDCLCEDYGLLEALSVDMLDPEETRLYAEHLEKCERCRKKCAEAFELGVYDDSPFMDRMEAYKSNPASEKDENWKKIAATFNPNLSKVNAGVSIDKIDIVAPIRRIDPKPTPKVNRSRSPRTFWWTRQRVVGVAAVVVCFVGAGLLLPILMMNQTNPTVPGDDFLKGASSECDAAAEPLQEAAEPGGFGAPLKELAEEKLRDVAEASTLYEDGRRLFDQENYVDAVDEFEELVQVLDEAKGVDAQILFGARWNLSVAKANAGDAEGALAVLNSLKEENDKIGSELDDAIQALEQTNVETENE